MNCEIIKDLLPLYIDGCCSDDSNKEVEKHLKECKDCKVMLDDMQANVTESVKIALPNTKPRKTNVWLASIMQSALFFISFLAITIGVALEAATPVGNENGYWAFNIVVPVTGFMLSLANWYFIRLYKSKDSFSVCSLIATVLCMSAAFIWATEHYNLLIGQLNLPLIVILCVLSYTLSYLYAKLLGKE